MRAILVLVSLAVPALACEPKGTPIFRIVGTPVENVPAPPFGEPAQGFAVEVFADGAWTHVRGGQPDGSGCLAPRPLALFKKALAKARLRNLHQPTCMALTTMTLTYSAPARDLSVQTGEPCGTPVDAATARAAACVSAAVDPGAKLPDILAACRGTE